MYSNYIHCKDRGIIFAYLPKVACTNWKCLLRHAQGKKDWLDTSLAHDRKRSGFTYLSAEEVREVVAGHPETRLITMVRDPYSRALSGYLNKIESRIDGNHRSNVDDFWNKVYQDIDRFRSKRMNTSIYPKVNFEVFLIWVRDSQSPFAKDEHWAPQSRILSLPISEFDCIGRFENMKSDAAELLKIIGLTESFPTQDDVKFAPTSSNNKIETYYNDACVSLVNEIFSDDFDSFGYPRRKSSIAHVPVCGEPPEFVLSDRITGFVSLRQPYIDDDYVQAAFEQGDVSITHDFFLDWCIKRSCIDPLLRLVSKRAGLRSIVAVDAGAYMGQFSVALSKIARTQGIKIALCACEPNPLLGRALATNLELNGVEARVLQVAVDTENGLKLFSHAPGRMIGGALSGELGQTGDETVVSSVVPTVNLASLLPAGSVAVIKLDCGGYEPRLLEALAEKGRMQDVFVLSFAHWQADRAFLDGTFGGWLTGNYHVLDVRSWLHAAPAGELQDQLMLASADSESAKRGFTDLLAFPKSIYSISDLIDAGFLESASTLPAAVRT